MDEQRKSVYLDCLRGVSALLVFIGHFRYMLFAKGAGVPAAALLFTTGLAHQAVIVFFVLSGYLIGGKLLLNRRNGAPILSQSYVVNRAARIIPPLLGAILITLLCDDVTRRLAASAHLALESEIHSILPLIQPPAGMRDVAVNLCFLQGFAGRALGSNEPLWSLAFEWWIYVIFPLLLSRRTLWLGLPLLVAASVRGEHFLPLLLVWSTGALLRVVESRIRSIHWPIFISVTMMVVVVNKAAETTRSAHLLTAADLTLGVLTALSIPIIGYIFPMAGAKLWKKLASFSYTLYLTHFPIMIVLYAALCMATGNQSLRKFALNDAKGWAIFTAEFALMLAAAYLLSLLFERPLAHFKKATAAALDAAARPLARRRA